MVIFFCSIVQVPYFYGPNVTRYIIQPMLKLLLKVVFILPDDLFVNNYMYTLLNDLREGKLISRVTKLYLNVFI